MFRKVLAGAGRKYFNNLRIGGIRFGLSNGVAPYRIGNYHRGPCGESWMSRCSHRWGPAVHPGSPLWVLRSVVTDGWPMLFFLVVCLRGVDAVTRRVGTAVIESVSIAVAPVSTALVGVEGFRIVQHVA